MTSSTKRYLSVAETAKLVRVALKKHFPNVKFSVRSNSYSGGASIDVKWTDGPLTKDVERIAKKYEGADFDGSIDLKTYQSHYLRPDGEVFVAHNPGTQGSMGYIPPEDNRGLSKVMPADVEEVHFGADYIFCSRIVSDWEKKRTEIIGWIYKHCTTVGGTGNPNIDQFGNYTVDHLATNMAANWIDGEDLAVNFERTWNRA